MNTTPSANRLHIGIFGKRNSGKSSLINALTNQSVSIVSDTPGTTTDPVYKAMEISKLGPCVFIDTAGFDDVGELGALRNKKTHDVLNRVDVALILITDDDFTLAHEWIGSIKSKRIPFVIVINKCDEIDCHSLSQKVFDEFNITPLNVSAKYKTNIQSIFSAIDIDYQNESLTRKFISENDLVMLVMPQDIGAPKGRLILPQVQTIRDLLDNHAIIISVTPDEMQIALDKLKSPPDLIITDSQAFQKVYALKPPQSKLTSFSILFAAHKGDLNEFMNGAKAFENLTHDSRILIAESCTHAPQSEDIGRVKIPNMIKKKFGASIKIDIVSGNDFPDDLSQYSLIIQCGGCMFNRRHMISRINSAKEQHIPITNYGIALAYFQGILNYITI